MHSESLSYDAEKKKIRLYLVLLYRQGYEHEEKLEPEREVKKKTRIQIRTMEIVNSLILPQVFKDLGRLLTCQ